MLKPKEYGKQKAREKASISSSRNLALRALHAQHLRTASIYSSSWSPAAAACPGDCRTIPLTPLSHNTFKRCRPAFRVNCKSSFRDRRCRPLFCFICMSCKYSVGICNDQDDAFLVRGALAGNVRFPCCGRHPCRKKHACAH